MQVPSAALSKSKDMPLHNCLHERNPPKVDSIVEWFIQFTRHMRFSNLLAARNTTPYAILHPIHPKHLRMPAMSPTPSGVSPKIKALLADEEAKTNGQGIWRSK